MYVTEIYVINESKNLITTVSFLNVTYRTVYTRDIFEDWTSHIASSARRDIVIYMQGC